MDVVWVNYIPKNTLCSITVFDDGNEIYKKYSNIWNIIKTNNKGKVQLLNTADNITIPSISLWKVKLISCDAYDAYDAYDAQVGET